MSADISDNLKELLDSIPDDVFEREWKKIKEMGLGGITVEEYFRLIETQNQHTQTDCKHENR